MNKIKY